MSGFTIPLGVIHNIEALCRSFLWVQGGNAQERCRISLDDVGRPIMAGGLGFRRLATWNHAFLAKHLWKIMSKCPSLWILWIAWINMHCLRVHVHVPWSKVVWLKGYIPKACNVYMDGDLEPSSDSRPPYLGERNARLFRKNTRSMDALLKDVKEVVIARMAWKDRIRINDRNEA
ncbi:hypothetical protein OSB04_019558 [Centaurea solstitialis]|uniref:Uncharacterized protein n=1 Tax=Centaurea solstitialis TaxID=347529 RepID=A0AA38T2U5_9ASTR|nr:hypothetical protein OSB04_019558 [Centaurea solstitialis]